MLPGVGLAEGLVLLAILLMVLRVEDIVALARKAALFRVWVENYWRGMLAGWRKEA